MTLGDGDFYFAIAGSQSFIFSRNVIGINLSDYARILNWTQAGGSRLVRVQLIEGYEAGITSTGEIDEAWAEKWERVFDIAEINGIYIIPVFTSWFEWNDGTPDYGYSIWATNPLNQANGGPADEPGELFQEGSTTQSLWLHWLASLTERWQTRENIAAWEIFSEVNLASGVTERTGVDFIESAASLIREADPRHRPIAASLADTGGWAGFYRSDAIDFTSIHPYPPSGQLDRAIVADVHRMLADYHKPVLIGESGLSATPPNATPPTLTTADNAHLGIEHAMWAAVASGAMNGRALYWEDSYAIYFPALNWPFLQKHADAELAAANFVRDVDFTGFEPLAIQLPAGAGVWGAAVGNEESVIGWFRDAPCEPPDWNLQPLISGQSVTIVVPGSSPNWRVDFYSTETGTDIIGSITATRSGNTITIALPDFTDDIAFKMYAQ
jgi:hypothetical protein